MPAPTTESDNYKLLFAILDQLESKKLVKNLDWEGIAFAIGIERAKTAQEKWRVLRIKQGLGSGGGAAASGDGEGEDGGNGEGGGEKKSGKKKNDEKKSGEKN